jgi:hypothetical protein
MIEIARSCYVDLPQFTELRGELHPHFAAPCMPVLRATAARPSLAPQRGIRTGQLAQCPPTPASATQDTHSYHSQQQNIQQPFARKQDGQLADGGESLAQEEERLFEEWLLPKDHIDAAAATAAMQRSLPTPTEEWNPPSRSCYGIL